MRFIAMIFGFILGFSYAFSILELFSNKLQIGLGFLSIALFSSTIYIIIALVERTKTNG